MFASAMAFLAKVSSMIPAVPAWATMVIGVVSEMLMKFWPTAKPLSWFLAASKALGAAKDLLVAVCGVLQKCLDFMGNLGQNLKDPQPAPAPSPVEPPKAA